MDIVQISIITTLSTTLAIACIYLYLYVQYRENYIGLWLICWLLLLSRLFFRVPLPELDVPSIIMYQHILIASSILLVHATNLFLERKTDKRWVYLALLVSVIGSSAMAAELPFPVKTLPVTAYMGAAHIWAGILFIRYLYIRGWGKNITGLTFILLGIHYIDSSFCLQIEWFAPWGFLIDTLLRFTNVTGILIVYFEKTRQDLVDKEQSYRLLAENALDVIYRYRLIPEPGFEYISPSVTKLTGYRPEEFYLSKNIIVSLVHPNDRPLLDIFTDNPNAVGTPLTLRFIRKDHSVIWVEQRAVPIYNETGTCVGFEGIIRDITSRKILEQDVSRLDRLNTVGQMAANVAHEIRNPITTIHGYLQLFLNKQTFADYKDQIQLLIDELNRANLIIKEYLSLSQNKIVELKPVNLNTIVQSLYPLIKADANGSSKEIKLNLHSSALVYVDEKEIRQLILNLVRNGLEAMNPGKLLFIKTEDDAPSHETILIIKDQGSGIPPNVLENLGRPFITTKDNGTGLGLAICYQIVNRHQAKICAETSREGTTFYVRFKTSA